MGEVIEVPFGIDYKAIASGCVVHGQDTVIKQLVLTGLRESVARVIVKRALSRGWGS